MILRLYNIYCNRKNYRRYSRNISQLIIKRVKISQILMIINNI